MKEEKTTPLRQRMIEDMNIRGSCEKTQQGHSRCVKHFASFLGRSPDTATPDDLRAYQLQMTRDLVSATTFNVRIISLRFFFSVTCGREETKRYMQFHRQPRKLPVVLSVEEVAKLLASMPGPGLKYRAALGISYGAGLRASEVCNLKVRDIDSQRMLIRVDQAKGSKDRQAMPGSQILVANSEPLTTESLRLISVKGIGPVVAAVLMARLPELSELDHRQLASLAGLAPHARDSGLLRGKRQIWGGRADVRRALYIAAKSASQWDPVFKAFRKRLTDAGKPLKTTIVACARKLLTILAAMFRRGKNYRKPLVCE